MTKTDNKQSPTKFNPVIALIPLAVFIALASLFYKQLASGGAKPDLPSALIDKIAPVAKLPPISGLVFDDGRPVPGLDGNWQSGQLTLVNVWASWCGPCRIEHPVLMKLASEKRFRIVGINHKDSEKNAFNFLRELGNPYQAVGRDPKGRHSIEWGVYGIPETFIVDQNGKIIFKHVGPLTEKILDRKFGTSEGQN